jgi:hypothetical protein
VAECARPADRKLGWQVQRQRVLQLLSCRNGNNPKQPPETGAFFIRLRRGGKFLEGERNVRTHD